MCGVNFMGETVKLLCRTKGTCPGFHFRLLPGRQLSCRCIRRICSFPSRTHGDILCEYYSGGKSAFRRTGHFGNARKIVDSFPEDAKLIFGRTAILVAISTLSPDGRCCYGMAPATCMNGFRPKVFYNSKTASRSSCACPSRMQTAHSASRRQGRLYSNLAGLCPCKRCR